jgi:hypothetical protein
MARAAALTLALLTAATAAAAGVPPGAGEPVGAAFAASAGPAWRRAGPAQAVLAGVAYPGLGQLVVGSEWKAAAVGAAQAYLAGRLLLEHRWTRRAQERYDETQSEADYDDYSAHYDRRQTLLWWVLGIGLLSVADAYVDAHLTGFDGPGPPEGTREGRASFDDAALRVGLAVRF